jgi:hypothetical protein
METDFFSALQQLKSYSMVGDNEGISKVCIALDGATVREGAWPPGFYDGLEDVLRDQNFLSAKNSWNLLLFIQNNWASLSSPEQIRIRRVLADAFDKYGDWMGAFVTSEILGEHYADESTLAILADLAKNARLPARAAVPHGLETLANATQQGSMRGLAINQLQGLLKSDSEEVRQEALISLKKLGK